MLRKLVLLIGLGLSATASQGVEIKLTGQDGFQLYGDYVAASHGQGKGVLMLHQCNADRSMYESLATQLAKSGITMWKSPIGSCLENWMTTQEFQSLEPVAAVLKLSCSPKNTNRRVSSFFLQV